MKRLALDNSSLKFTNSLIGVLSRLSAIEMFGHLFDVHPVQLTRIQATEKLCQQILQDQLFRDVAPGGVGMRYPDKAVAFSELEQSLSGLFSSQSTFWERYYSRKSQRTESCERDSILSESTISEIMQVSRHCYPYFFTTIEAMYFSDGQRQPDYKLMLLSLQAVLTGLLLGISGYPALCKEHLTKALKLIGPMNAPVYRECVLDLLSGTNEIQQE